MDGATEQVIKLGDGGPWGFRLSGGADYGCPIQVAKVRVNSKAYNAGLEEGDIITKVDDEDVSLASHAYVMRTVAEGGDNITITVLRGVTSIDDVYRTLIQTSRDNSYRHDNQPLHNHHHQQQRQQQQQRSLHLQQHDQQHPYQSDLEPRTVYSREPSVSKAQVVLGRAPSPSRSLRILTRSQSIGNLASPKDYSDRLSTIGASPERETKYITFQSEVIPERLPPSKPGRGPSIRQIPASQHRATSLPRITPGTTITQSLHPVVSSEEPTHSFFKRATSSKPVVVPIKPFEMPKQATEIVQFKVRDVNAPKHVWNPNNQYGGDSGSHSADPRNYRPRPAGTGDKYIGTEPTKFYWDLMENQPDHLPGYVDPLIVDDTQGDFGGNPIIQPERDLYSDSNFFTTKDGLYPTIPEQMRLCRMISGTLEAPDAMRSRGGKMYHKRKQGSESWSKEAMGRKYERPYDGYDADYGQSYDGTQHWPSTMKENLTVDELERLEHNTENLSKHDLLPPVVAFDINSALKNSKNHGKGVEIYRKHAERAKEYTIDENNRKREMHPNRLDKLSQQPQHSNTYKSPWSAAWEGNLDRAFTVHDPCAAQSVRDEPDLRKDTNTHALNYDHQQATFGVKYKDVAPVRAPRGPGVLGKHFSSSTSALDKVGRPETRLSKMIAARKEEEPTFDTYTYKWCTPSYYGKDLMGISANERLVKSQTGSTGFYKRPTDDPTNRGLHHGSTSDLTLRRPKEYIKPMRSHVVDASVEYPSDIDSGPPPNLRRPRDYYETQSESYYPNSAPLSVVTTPYSQSYCGGSGLTTPTLYKGLSSF